MASILRSKVGRMHDSPTSRVKTSEKINGVRNSKKLKNPAAQSYVSIL